MSATTPKNNGAAKNNPIRSATKPHPASNGCAGLTTQPTQYDLFKK